MTRLFSISTIVVFLALFMFVTEDGWAQEVRANEARVSPNASVTQTIGTTVVEVRYGRPSVNGRMVFGGLQSYDRVWRSGANEATAILFSDDVLIEGEPLDAGSYSFYTIPRENGEWTVIINNIHSWGLSYNESGDVLRVNVTPEDTVFLEQLMYYFDNVSTDSGTMYLHWGEVRIPVEISTP